MCYIEWFVIRNVLCGLDSLVIGKLASSPWRVCGLVWPGYNILCNNTPDRTSSIYLPTLISVQLYYHATTSSFSGIITSLKDKSE